MMRSFPVLGAPVQMKDGESHWQESNLEIRPGWQEFLIIRVVGALG